MKKMIISLFILVLVGSLIFFTGWVSFFIPAGQYGVLISKTGGTHKKTLYPGAFNWHWEHIIPTNTKILNFDISPQNTSINIKGVLPSGEVYKKMFEGNPDFSWEIMVTISGKVNPEKLPFLAEKLSITDQEALNKWTEDTLKNKTTLTSQDIITEYISDTHKYETFILNPASIANEISTRLMNAENSELIISNVTIDKILIPDFSLYLTAKETYSIFQQSRNELLAKIALQNAGDSVSEYLQIERMGQWGELLSRYPILIDFLKITGTDSNDSLKAIQKFR
ncbi:MAG TPA: hypothetical protein VJ861_01715 [Treponemataceae bacterium]|nr:hypothetical protein [Treponemataceae bacterium]